MDRCRKILPAGAFMLALALAMPAQAQSADAARIRELERKLERSLALIDELAAKVARLERAGAEARDAQAQNAQQAARIEAIDKHVTEVGNAVSRQRSDDGLPIHGFSDVRLVKSGENNVVNPKGAKGAVVGNFDLYLAPHFSDRVKALAELNFEVGEKNRDLGSELERLQIGYAFSDAATAWFGRFHTPYGYWNTAFHHGAQIQTSVLRPRFLDFEDEGGILPAHTVGGWLTGSVAIDGGKLGYDGFVGNAPQILGTVAGSSLAATNPGAFSAAANAARNAGTGALNPRAGGSDSFRSSAGFNVWLEPRALEGLRLGVHGLRAEVVDDAANANRTRLAMLGGYFAHAGDPWEAYGEYYRFRNRDLSGGSGSHDSWAAYLQLGYTMGKWTPFARAERTRLDQTDNYFGLQASGRSYQRVAVGLRYDIEARAALKLEFDHTRIDDLGPGRSDRYPEVRMQYAIRF